MQTFPPPGTTQQPVVPAPPTQPPPPARSRSTLGRLTLSLAVFAVGVTALVDVAGAHVPVSVYFAVPLAVVAAGLLVGTWYGRARGLIGLGVGLCALLAVTTGTGARSWTAADHLVTWRPATVADLQSAYRIDAGNALLDLSGLDFSGQHKSVDVHVSAGNLTVMLPPNVDVESRSTVDVGNASVLGEDWGGIGHSEHTVTDAGTDGPGGGELTLTATVNAGDLEVHR